MQKVIKFIKHNPVVTHWRESLAIIALILIAFISHRVWFNLFGDILFFGDWRYKPDEMISQMNTGGSSMWASLSSVGAPNVQPYMLLPQYIWGMLGSFAVGERLLYMIPIAILSLISPYFLVRNFISNKLIAVLSALMYAFSTYLLMRSSAHLPIAFVISLAPLVLFTFIRFIKNMNITHGIQFLLFFTISCIYELRITFILSIVLMVYFIIFVEWKKLNNSKWLILCLFGIFILLNLFWILPTPFLGNAISEKASRGLWGDSFFSLTRAISFSDYNWTGGELATNLAPRSIKLHVWIVPIISIIGMISFKWHKNISDKKNIIFFSILAVGGILLTKQSDSPLPSLYGWLYSNLPGFSLFREASKYNLIVGLGYLGLFAYGLDFIYRYVKKLKHSYYLLVIGSIVLSSLLVINAIPIVNQKIGGLSKGKSIPADYKRLDQLITSDKSYYRTLWVPFNDELGYFDINHPKISLWSELSSNSAVRSLSPTASTMDSFSNVNTYTQVLKSEYGNELLDNWNVKYLVVPPELPDNIEKIFPYAGVRSEYIKELDSISYLKKINLGTIDVYENTKFSSHISARQNLYQVNNYDNLGNEILFLKQLGIESPNFYTIDKKIQGASRLRSLFYKPYTAEILGKSTLIDKVDFQSNDATLYKNSARLNLQYQSSNKNVDVFTKQLSNPSLDGDNIDFPISITSLASAPIFSSKKTILKIDDTIIPIVPNKTVNLGAVDRFSSGGLYTLGFNRIQNGSFENGIWQYVPSVSPGCSNFNQSTNTLNQIGPGNKSLELRAAVNNACAATLFSVPPGSQTILSFNFKGDISKYAGYSLVFNDPAKTIIENKIKIDSDEWSNYNKPINVPRNATTATLILYAYKSQEALSNAVLYDDIAFQQTFLEQSFNVPKDLGNSLIDEKLNLSKNSNVFSVLNDEPYNISNLIDNPSFESGLWTPKVGDCNKYDSNPKIFQSINHQDYSNGKQSFQLGAIRHIACVSTVINLVANGGYSFSFDYKGQNAKYMGYNIKFNNDERTSINEKIPLDVPGWQNYRTVIDAPPGATNATLTIYSYASDEKINNVVLYDNFKFIKIPEINNVYNLVTNANTKFVGPKKISFKMINPTKYSVQITESAQSFLLSFNEKFDPGWKIFLEPINKKEECIVDSGKGIIIKNDNTIECINRSSFTQISDINYLSKRTISNDSHIEINGFANGWIIDSSYIKNNFGKQYYNENSDGSLDFNLVIYYQPQLYHVIGLIISGLTFLIGLTVYLFYLYNANRTNISTRKLKK